MAVNTLKLAVNDMSVYSTDYLYDASITPKITFKNVSSANPMLKDVMLVNGVNFGNDSYLRVFLDEVNEVRSYKLSIWK